MQQELVQFSFEKMEVRAMIDSGNEPWFVVKDICDALEIQNTSIGRFDLDESEVQSLYIPELANNFTMVNESGLYTLIIRSNKPQARPFRKWVTSEVLPAIRRTGSFTASTAAIVPITRAASASPAPATAAPLALPNPAELAKEVRAWRDIGKTLGYRDSQLVLATVAAIKKRHGVDLLDMLGQSPYVPAVVQQPLKTATDLGKEIGLSGQAFNKLLELQGFQENKPVGYKEYREWVPTAKGESHGCWADSSKAYSNGAPIRTWKWYPSILTVIVLPNTEAADTNAG